MRWTIAQIACALSYRRVALLIAWWTVAEGPQHVFNRRCWTAYCRGPDRDYSPRNEKSGAFSYARLA
jgi:hypothetical protein